MENLHQKVLQETFFLGDDIPFLFKGMEIDAKDQELLEKWGFGKPVCGEESALSVNPALETTSPDLEEIPSLILDQTKIKDAFETFSAFEQQLQEYSQQLFKKIGLSKYDELKYSIENEDFQSLMVILEKIPQMKNELLLYLNTHCSATPESLNMCSFGLNTLLGGKLHSSKKELQYMLLTSIVSKIFFFHHTKEKIKLMFIKGNYTIDSPEFIKKRVDYIIQLLKKIDSPAQIKYLIIFQHEAVDGSGVFQLPGDRVTLSANILGLIKFYTWHQHPFSLMLNDPHPYSINELLKQKSKFFPEVLNAFINVVGFFEIGSIIEVHSPQGKQLAMVIRNNRIDNGIKKPIVKIIMNSHRQIDYSRNLIDLNSPETKKWKLALMDQNSTIVEKMKGVFKKNILENKYVI